MESASGSLPEDFREQWELLLVLLSSEERTCDITQETEIDTVRHFLESRPVGTILDQWLQSLHSAYAKKRNEEDTALKCDDVSLLWRQRGNESFRCSHYEDSYFFYTKSVLYAKQDGPMYPLALANRSAALLRLKKYKDCLADANLALESGYPQGIRYKLLGRQCDCYIELGMHGEAEALLRQAHESFGNANPSLEQSCEFKRHLKMLERKLEAISKEPENNPVEIPLPLPQCYKGDNTNFVNASNAVELRRREDCGRYVMARETVRRGDVLLSEEPYAWVAVPGNNMSVCESCCRTYVNSIPCRNCSRSIYCGVECRSNGDVYHRWECVGAQSDLFTTIGIAHLGLRVLLVAATEGFPQLPPNSRTPTNAAELFAAYSNVNVIGIYHRDAHPFYRMFNLVTNFNKMNPTDYMSYSVTAVMLIFYLEMYTRFFEYLPSRVPYSLPPKELRLFAAGLILRSLGQLVCNGHATLRLEITPDSGHTVSEREKRIATAIYPSAAMMNHSCDPNIINTFHNNRLIIRCAREMSAGGEVLNCYGPHRARGPTPERRSMLRSQYMFTCNCTACIDPEQKDFALMFTAYACQACRGPVIVLESHPITCLQCNAEFRLADAIKVIEAADALIGGASELAPFSTHHCEQMLTALRMKQSVLHRHHTGLRTLADTLARLYLEAGEFTKSVELIKQNIQTVEYQFGSFSGEVAHELRKLTDVMMERIIISPHHTEYKDWCLETHKIIKKAIQLVELNYGTWEPLLKSLREKEDMVASQLARDPEDPVDCVHNKLHYNLKI